MTESIEQKEAQLMGLADAFCNASDNVTQMLGANAGMDENNGYWVEMKRARDALEAAIRTELQESFAAGVSCRPSSVVHTEVDQLKAELEAARAAKVFYPSIDAKVARLVREIDALLFHVERGEIELAHKKLTYIESILRAELSEAQAEPVYVQVRHKTEYGMSEWGVPLDPKEQHSTWADGVEMRLLYTTPPSTSHQKVARLEKSHELARRLLTVATWAAGKIIIERKRGASTAPHAEVDALVCANESIRSWLMTTGWSGCIERAPTLEEIAAIASTKPGATP